MMNEVNESNHLRFVNGLQDGYTCCMCHNKTDLDNSISCRGVNLICTTCACKMSEILFDNPYNYGEVMVKLQTAGQRVLARRELNNESK